MSVVKFNLKFDDAMMETAYVWANLSYCLRRKVGAVIAKNNVIISNGINGTVSGKENNCEYKYTICPECGSENKIGNQEFLLIGGKPLEEYTIICDVKCNNFKYTVEKDDVHLKTSLYTLHAEQNAIANASKNDISVKGSTLYCTSLPCAECSKQIVNHGIIRVVYSEDYKDNATIEFLKDCGVLVQKIEDLRMSNDKEEDE